MPSAQTTLTMRDIVAPVAPGVTYNVDGFATQIVLTFSFATLTITIGRDGDNRMTTFTYAFA